MRAYIINLDGATERWKSVSTRFAETGIPFERVPAVNGIIAFFATLNRRTACMLSSLSALALVPFN